MLANMYLFVDLELKKNEDLLCYIVLKLFHIIPDILYLYI